MTTRSIDAVKKITTKKNGKKISAKKKDSRRSVSLTTSKISRNKPEEKKPLMWMVVAGFMVLVVIGWVYFLRSSLTNDLSRRGGGFEEIANGFNRLFYTIDKKFEKVKDAFDDFQDVQTGSAQEEVVDEEIQELREKVFPQFENINTNSNI